MEVSAQQQRNRGTGEQRNKGMTHRGELRGYIYRAGCSHSLEASFLSATLHAFEVTTPPFALQRGDTGLKVFNALASLQLRNNQPPDLTPFV